jgi:NTE family protein
VETHTSLTFQLIDSDRNTGKSSDPALVNVTVKRVQRAIIFQGGVALGAYEAGVFHAIVNRLIERRSRGDLENKKRPLFDIVAGASIGAMNGAIVVSSVTKSGRSLEDEENWKEAARKVIDFWRAQKYPFPLPVGDSIDMNPLFHSWWDIVHNTSKAFKRSVSELAELYSNMNPALKLYGDMLASYFLMEPGSLRDFIIDGWYIPATAEAARRYYSAKQIDSSGAPNVASGTYPWSTFTKFFDFSEISNIIPPRPDNKHFLLFSLKRTLEGFARFPIKTKEGQPRFLLVTVDVQTGDAVTFDSYSKETKYNDNKNTIYANRGVEIQHALATGTFPGFFDYPKFKVETGTKSEEHVFWDGGFRSNTPLREVIQAHRDYWLKRTRNNKEKILGRQAEDEEDIVPDLEVYIADLWPSELKEEPISFDLDFVDDRKFDLMFGDKTDYDQQVATVVTDYVDLAKQLRNLAMKHIAKDIAKEKVNEILDSEASSIGTIGDRRTYRDLLKGRFRLTKVVRIDHKDDGNDVSKKIFDYSPKTIENLMDVGYKDALVQMDMQQMKDEVLDLAKGNGQMEDLEKSIYQIQEKISIEQDGALIKQVRDFMDKVENMGEVLRREEQVSLIAAAKQLEDTITVEILQRS